MASLLVYLSADSTASSIGGRLHAERLRCVFLLSFIFDFTFQYQLHLFAILDSLPNPDALIHYYPFLS
jgi:hypothetical protein